MLVALSRRGDPMSSLGALGSRLSTKRHRRWLSYYSVASQAIMCHLVTIRYKSLQNARWQPARRVGSLMPAVQAIQQVAAVVLYSGQVASWNQP
jgi:hypothetical protein